MPVLASANRVLLAPRRPRDRPWLSRRRSTGTMTVAVLAKSGDEAIKLVSEWVQVVRDPSKTIANALLVYPPGRDMVVAVESLLKGVVACIKNDSGLL